MRREFALPPLRSICPPASGGTANLKPPTSELLNRLKDPLDSGLSPRILFIKAVGGKGGWNDSVN